MYHLYETNFRYFSYLLYTVSHVIIIVYLRTSLTVCLVLLILSALSLNSVIVIFAKGAKQHSNVKIHPDNGIPGTHTPKGKKTSPLSSTKPRSHHQSSPFSSVISSVPQNIPGSNSGTNNKVVIINFDDGWKSQFTLAKPILDSFGFKATFFVVCNYVEKGASSRMDWQDISQLQNEGYDIESHTMDHKDLTTLSLDQVNYEVGQSKQCLADHGIDSSVFAYPFASGANDPSVVDIVSKYYDIARTGGSKIELLHPADRYSISAINHASKIQQQQPQQVSLNDNPTSLSSSSSLDNFIQIVNSESKYNRNGIVNAIPIIVYHQIGSEGGGGIDKRGVGAEGSSTDINLFAQEMKYLHDNGFTVLTMANLRYNQNDNSLYIPGITAGAPSG
jgi:peptidoglycan/xylan/chitin deacetylase (PgdA/CDA1 family)